jgi:hypothetical protein
MLPDLAEMPGTPTGSLTRELRPARARPHLGSPERTPGGVATEPERKPHDSDGTGDVAWVSCQASSLTRTSFRLARIMTIL